MKVLLAPDKFKGSLSALEAAEALARGWRAGWPEAELELAPIADGGEGFAATLRHGLGGEWVEAPAHDALGRPIQARYAWCAEKRLAVIEMSEAAGLWRLADDVRDPLRASTRGVGELVRHAVERGAREICIGLGGSATTDGGAGLAAALGFAFLEANGAAFDPLPINLPSLARLEASAVPTLPWIVAACDVENPLLGARGTAQVFAAQKGASPEQMVFLEQALEQLAEVVLRDLGCEHREAAGAGAAGGLGFGLMSFCGATVRSGFDLVAEVLELPRKVAASDFVVTGEGRLDRQTLEGKGPAGVAALARQAGRPVIALAGSIQDEVEVMRLFDAVCPMVAGPMPLAEALASGAALLERAAERTARLLRLGTLRLANPRRAREGGG